MMQANPFASLPGNLGARAAALVAQREADGCNVHFVNERGQRDRYSLRDAETAKRFADGLRAAGRRVFASEAAAKAWEASQ